MLNGDKFMSKLHLRQPRFTYRPCGPNHCKRIQKFMETGDLNYIFKKKIDKACFAHDEAYAGSKEFAKKAISDKILKDRTY